MNIGITGGTGFLGSRLGEHLAKRGDRVLVFTRSPEGFQAPWGRAAAWRPMEEPIPPGSIDGLDALVHLAGHSAAGFWTESFKQRVHQSRVVSTRNLVAGLRSASKPPGILLCASATGYYGNAGDRELPESSEPGDGFMARLCRDWEAAAAQASDLARVVPLRTGLVLGPGGILAKMLPAFRLGLGAVLGDGRAWWPWIHIEDWVRLATFALDRETVSGPLNLASPHPVTNREFTRTLARVLGRPAFLGVPAPVLRFLARGAADEMALASQRVIPRKAEAEGFPFRFPDLEPALRNLLA